MPAPIRGVRVTENVYTYAHAAGRYFRHRAHDATLPPIRITTEDGVRVQTATLRDRKPRVVEELTDAGILKMLAKAFLSQETVKVATPSLTLTRVYHKRGQPGTHGPTLAIRG